MLNLQYNEMWNDWVGGMDESLKPENQSKRHYLGQLVLSWKRLNVWAKNTTTKYFEPSETTYKQILHNGNC